MAESYVIILKAARLIWEINARFTAFLLVDLATITYKKCALIIAVKLIHRSYIQLIMDVIMYLYTLLVRAFYFSSKLGICYKLMNIKTMH